MGLFFQSTALVWALFFSFSIAQSVQENYTICNWARVRAGVIRDTLYLDGGLLWWQTAFADGTTPVVSSDGNVEGDMFSLNFSTPFDTSKSNLSAILQRIPKAGGQGNNIAPNYIDGTIFSNNDEMYLYGGLPRLTNSSTPQDSDVVLGYEAFQYGPYRQSWSPGFYQGTLSSGVTRYITNGAGVSVPSENLGFYFSGMRSPDWGPIYYEDSSASMLADTMIEVDMSTMRSEKWTNTTLSQGVQPRANAELIWIPVSDQGILIAIGGVTDPEEIWAGGLNSSQTSESKSQSPSFMTSLSVYDIASQTWHTQNTTGDAPGQLTEFCSVMATANDSSSFNIYIYGGYDGLNADDNPSDDVWVLSVPAFTWVKAYSGTSSHGRSGHRCVMPYPDQMFVVGGIHQNQANCVEGGIIQVFNLNTLQFQNTYNPQTWSQYQVPSIITAIIGGSGNGGATKKASFSDSNLGSAFSKKYSKAITQYYPYSYNASADSSSSSPTAGGPSLSKAGIIAISVVAALVLLSIILLLLLLLRRRRNIRSGKSTSSDQSRISRWLNGTVMVSPPKSQSSETPDMQQMSSSSALVEGSTPSALHEVAGVERPKPPFELATPYNNQEHPRNAGIIDYAYSSSHGHSNSNSSGLDQPSPQSNQSHGPSPASQPQSIDDRLSSSSSESSVAWPFPSTKNTWRSSPLANRSHPSNVPTIPEHSGIQHMDETRDSTESEVGTLPSSTDDSGPHDDEHRRSHWSAISPISPR